MVDEDDDDDVAQTPKISHIRFGAKYIVSENIKKKAIQCNLKHLEPLRSEKETTTTTTKHTERMKLCFV